MRISLFWFIVFIAAPSFGPVSAQQTKLLLVHSRYDPGDTSNEYLVAYHFNQGRFFKQDTILHRSRIGESEEDGRVSVGFDDRIFNDRYMFAGIGLLIDLQEKKLLWEKSNLSFVERKENKLYFNRSFFSSRLELYEYDLETQVYKKVLERPFEGYSFRPELSAPDFNHFLETTYESPGKAAIILVDSMGKKRKVAIAEKPGWFFSGSKAAGKMPLAWTDEFHFVYPNYIVHPKKGNPGPGPIKPATDDDMVFEAFQPDSLACCSVELNEVDIRNGALRIVTTINGLYEQMTDDRLYKNASNELIFRNRGVDTTQHFRINLLSGEARPEIPAAPNFTIVSSDPANKELAPDDIFFKTTRIGRFHVYSDYSNDSVIVIQGSRTKEKGESLFVWSTAYPNWQQLPVQGFLGFFGWIKKKGTYE